ncbi:MAG: helix-turn-helix domain-containing protein [Planctomycetes bacterium]|nr:helix-turn-helix domain-containing protein [Planctomycetota bacterium]
MNRIFNGKAMAEARRRADMDQADLARRVSRNRVTISDIERGKLKPSSELAESVAAELGVPIESLYSPSAHTPSMTGQVSLTIDELQVIEAMRRLGEVQRAKIWAFAQGLAAGGGPDGARSAAELAEAIENASRTEQGQSDQRTNL